jgi:hypothetical protein
MKPHPTTLTEARRRSCGPQEQRSEVAECPGLVDRPVDLELEVVAGWRRDAGAAADGCGRDGREPLGDLRGAEDGPVADLHGGQRGFQRPAVLPAVCPGPAELPDVLAEGRAGFAGAQDVLVHRADVPRGAVGRGCPCLGVQRPKQRDGALQFVRLAAHRLLMGQRFDGGDAGGCHGHDGAPLSRAARASPGQPGYHAHPAARRVPGAAAPARTRLRCPGRRRSRHSMPACGTGCRTPGTSAQGPTSARRGIEHRPLHYLRSGLKPARTSSEKSCGCSQAAKWPPLSGLL